MDAHAQKNNPELACLRFLLRCTLAVCLPAMDARPESPASFHSLCPASQRRLCPAMDVATPSNPSHASGRPSAAFASHRGVGPVSPSGPPSTPSLTVTAPPRTGRLAAASRDRARPWSSMYRTLSLVQPLGRTCLSLWRSEYLNHAHWPQQQAWFGRGGGCATWGVYHTPSLYPHEQAVSLCPEWRAAQHASGPSLREGSSAEPHIRALVASSTASLYQRIQVHAGHGDLPLLDAKPSGRSKALGPPGFHSLSLSLRDTSPALCSGRSSQSLDQVLSSDEPKGYAWTPGHGFRLRCVQSVSVTG